MVNIFGDTWSWDGTDWAVLFNPPSSRSFASMAFDSCDRSADSLWRYRQFSASFNDTFNWDGIAWTELSPATSPSARAVASMAFDSTTNQLILFGGFDSTGQCVE